MKRIGIRIATLAILFLSACAVRAVCSEEDVKNPQSGKSEYAKDSKATLVERAKSDWGDRSGNNAEEPAGWEDSSNDDDNKK